MAASGSRHEAEAEAEYNKAARAELSRDYNKAFQLYTNAAERFLHLRRQTTDERLRSCYNKKVAKALERAEKISSIGHDLQPVAIDEFSEGEQLYVLQKSALVNQGFFPLWDSAEAPPSSSEQPPLSAEQIKHGANWRKAIPESKDTEDGSPGRDLDPKDIVQHIVSDCSVCGAMVVAIDHHRRFGSRMIISSLFPRNGEPVSRGLNTDQYHFKILYNGAQRRITIDDQLPVYPDGSLMCVSTGEKGQLWPSLVEKAYMKLAGGYEFIGSDSSTDLHALAGWIPEALDMKGPHFQREKTWDRLIQGYTTGNCVATIGTGEQVQPNDLPLALLPTHCYAIIGVHSTEEERKLTIFDPWVQPDGVGGSAEVNPKRAQTMELSMDTVYSIFDGIYLSWNPAMFKHKLTFHGMWKRGGKGGNTSTHFRTQVQLDLTSANIDNGEKVWVHLTRHVQSHRVKEEYIALTAYTRSAHSSAGEHDVLSTKGEYTNSPHILAKTAMSTSEAMISLVASYEGEREDVGFTLTVYSNHKASWGPIPQKFPYNKEIIGAFTQQKTAGGNHTYPTYYLNPQYHLHVHPRTGASARGGRESRDTKAAVSVTVSTDRHIPVNIMLGWSQGRRINELGHNDIALSSGAYNYGYAHATSQIPPGDYTLVVSAFEPRHIGKFGLHIECSDRFDITPILHEGAGMFSKTIRGSWTAETAGGGPGSGKYVSNPMYELHVPSAGQLKFRLQLAESSSSIALNVTIFNASTGSGTLGRHIATSGPYSDAVSGVLIDKLTLQPGKYLVVPSTYKPGVLASYKLIVYSTVSGVQLSALKQ